MRRTLPIVVLLILAALIAIVIRRRAGEERPAPATSAVLPAGEQAHISATVAEPSAPPGGTERRPATDPGAESAQAQQAPATAHLNILVIGKTKRAPIAGASVGLFPKDDLQNGATSEVARAFLVALRKPLTTTADGTVEADAPPNVPMEAWATVDDQIAGPLTTEIPALQAGERREIVLELPDANDAHVFGRIVTAEGQTPIRDARVGLRTALLQDEGGEEHGDSTLLDTRTTGADGTFEFDYPAWREPHLRVEASEYGVLLSEPLKECSDAAHPLVIELSRCASLRASVLDSEGRPLHGLLVDLVVDGVALLPEEQQNRGDLQASFPDESWHSKTGPDGRVTFSGLPARARIDVYLTTNGKISHPEGHGIELAPGETKEVEWRIGGGCTLRGVVLDGENRPVPGIRLWRTRAGPGGERYSSGPGGPWIEQAEITDDAGRFEFVGVPSGAWFLGPAPDEWGEDSVSANAIAPVPERIVIGSEPSKDVTLHVERGLYVRGRVLDPDGKPTVGLQVLVYDDSQQVLLIGHSDGQGEFAVGPLARQTVLLAANGQGRYLDSPQVRARAGASGVELRLRAGGWVRGRVVDAATGVGCSAGLMFIPQVPGVHKGDEGASGGSEDDGEFWSPACGAGSYSISAMTDDSRWALVKGIDVTLGAVHADVLLQVKPGGKLRLRYQGHKSELRARVTLDGVPMDDDAWLTPGKPRTVRAPAGQIMLEVRSRDGGLAGTRKVELQPSETKEITLTDED